MVLTEVLQNAVEHGFGGGAGRVEVAADRLVGRLHLTVEDDGCGFEPSSVPIGHYGLLTMRERADVSGGRLEIWSAPGLGTRVSVRFHAESMS